MSTIKPEDLLLVQRGDTSYKIKYQDLPQGGVEEAPVNGDYWVRRDKAWYETERFFDAPVNGNPYVRQNGSWEELSGGGGGIYSNVKDFGAVGDGSTDDWQAIQNCIDTVKQTGGTVYLPAGKYRVSKTLYYSRAAENGEPPNTNQKRVNFKGDGKGNTVIIAKPDTNSGIGCLTYVGDPAGSGAAHIYATISDLCFVGNSQYGRKHYGLSLEHCAYMSVNECTFHNLTNGLQLAGTLSCAFHGLIFNESTRGVYAWKPSNGFSAAHANAFTGCEFRTCTYNGYQGDYGTSTSTFVGCQFEDCGSANDGNTGGCLFYLNSFAGEVGPSFYGCYFENNKSGYDINFSGQTASGAVAVCNVYSCNFNRLAWTNPYYDVKHNIIATGAVYLNLHGCSFSDFGNFYVPNSGRAYVRTATGVRFTEVGCRFKQKIETPQRSQSLSYAGTVFSNGQGRVPSGWSITKQDRGVYRVNHYLNTREYAVVATSNAGESRSVQRVVISNNAFDVATVSTSDALTNCEFSFFLQMI